MDARALRLVGSISLVSLTRFFLLSTAAFGPDAGDALFVRIEDMARRGDAQMLACSIRPGKVGTH
jgi:hypothetical protein